MKNFAVYVLLSLVMLACHVMATPQEATTITVDLPIPPLPQKTYTNREIQCVRNAVYGEARGQPPIVQVAVAATIISRSESGKYPRDLCKVVKQANQFQGYSSVITLHGEDAAEAWDMASQVAWYAADHYQTLPEWMRKSMYFHDTSIKTNWHNSHKLIGKMGGLIFYAQST